MAKRRTLHDSIVADLVAAGRTREEAEALLERDRYAITWQPGQPDPKEARDDSQM